MVTREQWPSVTMFLKLTKCGIMPWTMAPTIFPMAFYPQQVLQIEP